MSILWTLTFAHTSLLALDQRWQCEGSDSNIGKEGQQQIQDPKKRGLRAFDTCHDMDLKMIKQAYVHDFMCDIHFSETCTVAVIPLYAQWHYLYYLPIKTI